MAPPLPWDYAINGTIGVAITPSMAPPRALCEDSNGATESAL